MICTNCSDRLSLFCPAVYGGEITDENCIGNFRLRIALKRAEKKLEELRKSFEKVACGSTFPSRLFDRIERLRKAIERGYRLLVQK